MATASMSYGLSLMPTRGGLGDGAEKAVWRWLAQRYDARQGNDRRIHDWPAIDFNGVSQESFVRECLPKYSAEYSRFPSEPSSDPSDFHFGNGYYERVDAELLHCMVRRFKPARVIEVGSGNSTKITRAACAINGKGNITSIDPHPRDDIGGIVDEQIQARVETVGVATFESLEANDFLFIDSSHRIWPENDVHFLFHQVLPRLRKGVIVHVHDIFLPCEYPQIFLENGNTEQDLLAAFLAFNWQFETIVSSGYLLAFHRSEVEKALGTISRNAMPGAYWMRRV
jgi:predicted O-methyltransferase YrrM